MSKMYRFYIVNHLTNEVSKTNDTEIARDLSRTEGFIVIDTLWHSGGMYSVGTIPMWEHIAEITREEKK